MDGITKGDFLTERYLEKALILVIHRMLMTN